MCGICGIISQKEKNKNQALEKMLFSLRPRGPDDQGIFLSESKRRMFKENVALGSRRLSIIDLSKRARQPLANEDKTIWLVFNGEIYNFPQLRKSLLEKGHRFSSKTDSEVVLHLYEELGPQCLEKLRGMFAFAIWDEKKRLVFAARDRLGIKPFYYHQKGDNFIFASEIKALLATGLISRQLDPQGIVGFLSLGSVPAPLTIIKGIKSLNPGEYLIWQQARLKVQSYWELEFRPKLTWPEQKILAKLKNLLEQSVKLRLVSDVPLGAFLSGGLDSTTIVCLARKFIKGKLKTFNITFPEASYSEADYARLCSEKFETEHHQVEITGKDLLKELDKVIGVMDQPTINGINTYFVSKITRQSGVTVALSGLGGDEVFSGYPSFSQMPRLYKVLKKSQRVPAFLRKGLSSLVSREKLKYLLRSEAGLENLYFVWRALFLPPALKRLVTKDYLPLSKPQEFLKTDPMPAQVIDQISVLETKNYLANQLLRDTDFMSMAHSLEVRVPLLDHKLVEFMAQVPAKLKKENLPKKLLVKALEDELPKQTIKRAKKTFTFPLQIWLKRELVPILEEVFSEASLKGSGIFKPVEVKKLWQKFQKGKLHWSRIWTLAII